MRHAASASDLPHYTFADGGSMQSQAQSPPVGVASLDMAMSNMNISGSMNGNFNASRQSPTQKHHFESPGLTGTSLPSNGNMQSLALPVSGMTSSASSTNVAGEKATLYKTELCRKWMTTGSCRYGTKCQFAHGEHELRNLMRHPLYKTSMCKSFQATGTCRYGSRCRFIHNEKEYELQTMPRAPSTNALMGMVNGAQQQPNGANRPVKVPQMNMNNMNRRVGQISFQEENNFHRVPSAPANLGSLLPAPGMQQTQSHSLNHSPLMPQHQQQMSRRLQPRTTSPDTFRSWNESETDQLYQRQHRNIDALPRNYSHQVSLGSAHQPRIQEFQAHPSYRSSSVSDFGNVGGGTNGNFVPTVDNIRVQRNEDPNALHANVNGVMNVPVQSDEMMFPTHLLDCRDIPVAKEPSNHMHSSANSSYSSTASSGNISTATSQSSSLSSGNFPFSAVEQVTVGSYEDVGMLKSRSHPVLYEEVGANSRQNRYDSHSQQQVAQNRQSFSRAPGTPPMNPITTTTTLNAFDINQNMQTRPSPSVSFESADNRTSIPTNTNIQQSTDSTETDGSRLDFFRSISEADLASMNLDSLVS